jgi:hypothetical protein
VHSMLSATTPLLTSPKLTQKTMPPEAHMGDHNFGETAKKKN